MKALAASESTVIMTIHDINLSAKYCQHLILMNDGQIYAQGTPAEVLTRSVCLMYLVWNLRYYRSKTVSLYFYNPDEGMMKNYY